MSAIFGNALAFLVDVTLGLYILIVLCRFLFQWLQVNFHNPVSQFILQVTSPLLMPMRKFIRGYGGIDIASLLLAYILTVLKVFLILFFQAKGFHFFFAFGLAVPDLVDSFLSVFLYAIFIQAILSWVPQMQGHPIASVLSSLTYPILNPIRRLIPPTSGFDFTPMVAIIAIMMVKLTIVPILSLIFGAGAMH